MAVNLSRCIEYLRTLSLIIRTQTGDQKGYPISTLHPSDLLSLTFILGGRILVWGVAMVGAAIIET